MLTTKPKVWISLNPDRFMKKKKLALSLNKEVIHRLDQQQTGAVNGGKEQFLSIWGSNCNNSDPNAHKCCTGEGTVSGACISVNTFHCGEITNC